MMRVKCCLILLFALGTLAGFLHFSSGQEPKKAATGGYLVEVLPGVCQACHPDLNRAFQRENPHRITYLDSKAPPDRKGCEACHGPAEKHVTAGGEKKFIFSFQDQKAKVRADVCLKCHQKQKEFFQFERGVHKLSALGCNDCHRIHGTPPQPKLLKAKQTDLCFSCHQEIKFKFFLPTRHKVLEGAMLCTDCHTPHGSRTRPSLRRWNKFNLDVCFQCHPEKRGPWVFEHPPVKYEGCTVCHTPHGSPNRFLLSHRDVRRVCIQCHGQRHKGDFLFSTEVCINCHTQIHGSNFSTRFFH